MSRSATLTGLKRAVALRRRLSQHAGLARLHHGFQQDHARLWPRLAREAGRPAGRERGRRRARDEGRRGPEGRAHDVAACEQAHGAWREAVPDEAVPVVPRVRRTCGDGGQNGLILQTAPLKPPTWYGSLSFSDGDSLFLRPLLLVSYNLRNVPPP